MPTTRAGLVADDGVMRAPLAEEREQAIAGRRPAGRHRRLDEIGEVPGSGPCSRRSASCLVLRMPTTLVALAADRPARA